ncbi:signal peptide peptidase SppA [Vibrio sp. 10N.286.49.B3]|uniref:signal peptide peptidase SppA n=1 Tax=Vibrio sp. 10N.286.49.B3 TaxID=1880855 RepID=UPI000C8440E7|nr:signal peptide peptidase SppA [Vibrio sp. 10N.286.49.B3]PMH40595.1 signal peptide peptidase SppA [Vibrio sp. 10N.286.49.B3]
MKKLFYFIGMVFKGIWKLITFTRLAIANVFFLLAIGLIYFVYFHAESPQPMVEKESALVLNLSGPIVEQANYPNAMDSITGSFFGKDMPRENVLFNIVETIRHAKDDPNISGIVLALRNMPETNLTKLRYISKALNEFKAAGKPIYATGDFYNQSQYYLASFANKVYLAPDGGVLLKGYSAYSMYYKTFLEKINVNTHIFRVGTYKSAVEPFLRDDMSDEAKASATRWLTQLWGAYVDDVASNRQIDQQTLNPNMDEFLAELKAVDGDIALLAKNLGLVDELATRQQRRDALVEVFGSDKKGNYNHIDYYQYRMTMQPDFDEANDDIAIVVASGAIMDGSKTNRSVGGDTTASLLRQARTDDKIKAVVVRVDSPGGSAFASEVIRNEIQAIKDAGKPVVVSMSSLAASGGYWISMNADKIVAQPTTLTGSIGIFSVMTTFEKGLNQYGIYSDGVGTSPFSGVGVTSGLSEGATDAIQLGIEHGYRRFTNLVSEQRGINLDDVDKLAQGRVWTGKDALQLGLVDKVGDFDDAISLAANLAQLEAYNLYWVKEPLSITEQFFQDFMAQAQATFGFNIQTLLPQNLQPISQQLMQDAQILDHFNDPYGRYAFCLNCQVQ